MRLDLEGRTVRIAVREIVERDTSAGLSFGLRERAEIGRESHAAMGLSRKAANSDYRCEVPIVHTMIVRGYRVTIHGRADGIERCDGRVIVDEYKSVALEPFELMGTTAMDFPAARLQLGIYLYLLDLEGDSPAGGRLVLRSIFGGEDEWILPVEPFHAEVAEYVEQRLLQLVGESERRAERSSRRRLVAARLPFPFPEPRSVQVAMKEEIEGAMGQGERLLLEAPTGSGKTAAVVHGLVQAAFEAGASLYYATAKTSGQSTVLATLERIVRRGGDVTGVVLTARAKVCPEEETLCRPEVCARIRDHLSRVSRSGVLDALLDIRLIDREEIVRRAERAGVCPFQLSLDLAGVVDVVIGDYNYVFSPGAYLSDLFEPPDRKWFLAIDEAHNLPSRGRAYYSSALSWKATRLVASWAEQRGDTLSVRVAGLVTDIQAYLWEALEQARLTEVDEGRAHHVPDVELAVSWRRTLGRILASEPFRALALHDWGSLDIPFRFYQQLCAYVDGVVHLDDTSSSIVERAGGDARLRVICHDPSRRLDRRMSRFGFVLAMSATLSPGSFYRDMLGMGPEAAWASFPSPFPRSHCARYVVGTLPDRFRERAAAIPGYVDVIRTVVEAKAGLYAVYVPSHAFLLELLPHLEALGCRLHVQRRDMDDRLRAALLRRLCRVPEGDSDRSSLLVAVLGGSFAEAIECPAGVLCGVIVLGPGLPKVCIEQEMLRDYYDERFGTGFAYAYVYPGMTRVVQSAGRLIRRESDRGCVVLVGERFREPLYAGVLPRHWYRHSPAELEAGDLGARLEAFWNAGEGADFDGVGEAEPGGGA